MESSSLTATDVDKKRVVDLCVRLLETLKLGGAAGREQFLATLAPYGTACHARAMVGTFDSLRNDIARPSPPKLQYTVYLYSQP